jgi:hypothetical protein
MSRSQKMILRHAIPSWQQCFGWSWRHTAQYLIRRQRQGMFV